MQVVRNAFILQPTDVDDPPAFSFPSLFPFLSLSLSLFLFLFLALFPCPCPFPFPSQLSIEVVPFSHDILELSLEIVDSYVEYSPSNPHLFR